VFADSRPHVVFHVQPEDMAEDLDVLGFRNNSEPQQVTGNAGAFPQCTLGTVNAEPTDNFTAMLPDSAIPLSLLIEVTHGVAEILL